jgi:hypothetical protein
LIHDFSTVSRKKIYSHKILTSFQGKRETPKKNVKEVIKKATMKKTDLMHTPNRKINSIMEKATSDKTEHKGNVVEKEDSNDLSDCAIEFTTHCLGMSYYVKFFGGLR